MPRAKRGCAPVAFIIFLVLLLVGAVFLWRSCRKERVPPPSGDELQVHVLDVGQGDSILIVSPEGKTVLVDAGDTGRGRVVLDALRRYNVGTIDLFIATHAHADHIGAADEVLRTINARTVLDSSVAPPVRADAGGGDDNPRGSSNARNSNARRRNAGVELPTTKAYQDFLSTVQQTGARYVKAEPGQNFDIGGGARISVLAPIQPFFTKDQLRSGGNEPNANSVVTRLDYGDFSMLLTGDAEAQTEARIINRGENLTAKVLKVGHHGSRYATSDEFIGRVRPEIAIISNGEANRYGHPSQETLDRLRARNVRVYRTDLQGEITIVTRGKGYEVKTAREADGNLFAGREPQRDDSARNGFVSYGDFGPPPRPARERSSAARR